MGIKKVILDQYKKIINSASISLAKISQPPEGWIYSVRQALNMSDNQLANRLHA